MFCQVSTDGIQAASCTYITFTSANIPSRVADASVNGYQLAPERSLYTCERCGSEFKLAWTSVEHRVKMKHGDIKQLICAQCSCSYVYRRGLKPHLNRIHRKLYRYRCETCEKGFMDRSRYFDHIAAHTGVKRYPCSICDMKFMNKTMLTKHVIHFHPNEAVTIL